MVAKTNMKNCCRLSQNKIKKKGKDKSWCWHFHQIAGNGSFYLRSLFKDAIVTRHLQPGESVGIVRGHGASNRAKIWVKDFNRLWHYPCLQAWIHGSVVSIYRHTAASAGMPLILEFSAISISVNGLGIVAALISIWTVWQAASERQIPPNFWHYGWYQRKRASTWG